MNLIQYKFNSKSVIINTLFVLFFIISIVSINPTFPYYLHPHDRLFVYVILAIIAVFYIHNTVMLPFLIEKKNSIEYKKYILVVLPFFIVTLLCLYRFHEFNKSYIWTINYKNLFTERELSKFIMLVIIPVGLSVLFSFFYSIFFLNKRMRLVFVEFLVNTIIVSLLYGISIDADQGASILLLTITLLLFYTTVFHTTSIRIKDNNKKKFWKHIFLATVLSYLVYYLVFLMLSKKHGTIPYYIVLTILITQFIAYIYGFIRLKIINKEKILTLQLGKKSSELDLLKSQVNPHFLFNSLNILYGTALEENATKTAQSTARLASLIRYMQEDIAKDVIPLKNEIKYIEDYIAIQKIRCSVEPEVELKIKRVKNHKISPGLLIPFIENAFKYGIDPSSNSKLEVAVICNEDSISFKCVNSYKDDFKTYQKERGFGIGIKNTKQRLDLVYPKKHTLSIKKGMDVFTVKLTINVSK